MGPLSFRTWLDQHIFWSDFCKTEVFFGSVFMWVYKYSEIKMEDIKIGAAIIWNSVQIGSIQGGTLGNMISGHTNFVIMWAVTIPLDEDIIEWVCIQRGTLGNMISKTFYLFYIKISLWCNSSTVKRFVRYAKVSCINNQDEM